MAHHPIAPTSPIGTPLPERTVAELVAERPGRSRIFQSHKIDFCCQGSRTLREACERKQVPLETVIRQIEEQDETGAAFDRNPADLSPTELCNYLIETHHQYLRDELPRLHAMSERVAHVHGGHTPSLVEIFNVFQEMAMELANHVKKEEEILFPAIASLDRGEASPTSLEGPICCMMAEHDEAAAALARLSELSNNYQPPAEACNTYRALFDGLRELQEDLHRHIHLENEVLFPAARSMVTSA